MKAGPTQNFIAVVLIIGMMGALGSRLVADNRAQDMEGPDWISAVGETVCISLDRTLYRLTSSGMFLDRVRLSDLGIKGTPADIQALSDGDVLIGDRDSGSIHRCNLDTMNCRTLVSPEKQDFQGLYKFYAVEARGQLFITDNDSHRLFVQDLNGSGNPLELEGTDFFFPLDLWMGQDGLLRVADSGHDRLVALQVEGTSIHEADTLLTGKNALKLIGRTKPVASTQSPNGDWWVLIADALLGNADLVVYDSTHELKRKVPLPDGADPLALAWVGKQIVLTDEGLLRIYTVDPETETIQDFGDAEFQSHIQGFRERKEGYLKDSGTALTVLILFAAAMLVFAGVLAMTGKNDLGEKEVFMEMNRMGDRSGRRLHIKPWPTEIPLFIIILFMSIGCWMFLLVSIIGIVYAAFIGLFLFISHLAFITYIRGSAVRLGPDQFPDLYLRIQELAATAGMKKVPEAYVMQAGGALNALATKFLRSRMIVLFSDLLDACGENKAARDMIIGHELGHIKAGHLQWLWFIFPGLLFPFLGSAYSQAREYTCDRYGAALCGDPSGALQGLTILAAGGNKGPLVNLNAFVNQRRDLNTGLMTLGKWLATHPPLCDRIAALKPSLISGPKSLSRGKLCAFSMIGALFIIPIALSLTALKAVLPSIQKAIQESSAMVQSQNTSQMTPHVTDSAAAEAQIKKDIADLARLVEEVREKTGHFPSGDNSVLTSAWKLFRTDQPEPLDPYDGNPYGYYVENGTYIIWGAGPDGESGTEDDVYYRSDQAL